MKIDGKKVASKILKKLEKEIAALAKKNITPHLAVVMIGDDPGSLSYISQKEKVGKKIGVKVAIYRTKNQELRITNYGAREELFRLLRKLNQDKSVHGIIIQRPLPIEIDKKELALAVIPAKDVDGFHPDSLFTPPVACAVFKILEHIYSLYKDQKIKTQGSNYRATVHGNYYGYNNWLKKKRLLVIGRGETGGKPIIETLKKSGISPKLAYSKTKNLDRMCHAADIIISCVGKPNIVRSIKNEAIIIGVGIHRENGKLKGDYDEEDIKDKVAAFTPTPGGVGPINVACLFENLIKAAKIQQS